MTKKVIEISMAFFSFGHLKSKKRCRSGEVLRLYMGITTVLAAILTRFFSFKNSLKWLKNK